MTTQPDDARAAATAPVTVGPYTLLTKIGEGGMGVVHLARKAGGERVALKILRSHIVGDDEARRRLAREVNSLGRIRSRWVAEIVDADPWAPVPYVATRYVPGLSLHDHVHHEGPIEGRDLLWFAGCLAEGLATVHAVGVLHRDVKPSNVLMEGRTPILIDFGLARVADDPKLTHTGWLLGTPGYLAPEILYGDDASAASDVHSWAATVAFAATGVPPFGRGPSMAIMDRVRRGEFDLGSLAPPLRDVVAAALDPDPVRRPTLAEILAWLWPQTTRPAPLLAAPPTGRLDTAPAVFDQERDPFGEALAVAAQAHGDPAAPTLVEPPAPPGPPGPPAPFAPSAPGTLLLPEDPTRRDPAPYAPTRVDRVDRAAPPYDQTHHPAPPPPAPLWYDPPAEPAPPVVPLAERLRRGVLALAGAITVGAVCAVAPWVAVSVVVVLVYLLRSGSLAASRVGERRQLRGRRWYDAPQLLIHTPWHLVQSIPGTLMLVLWAAGLAAAGGLICYAVAAPLELSLFIGGVLLAVSLWWGPGGSRVRSPLGRVVAPLSRSTGPWLVAVAVLLVAAIAAGLYVEAQGVSWLPGTGRPFDA